ncbi:hypothetical protein BTJ40_08640 [Microbulbifer sp. A4B17]|uniref:hypothetical protein n=1 Tax=Microbulbifer sp. A4B17 TaxID=359370 RepID=UPI000D52B2AB|nr:hypothetical protein [Microbulbifer sp. A4B17]AWF80865.1 hypothetical protein BTJ40_08640 [Microbulbifer sp. A4B17]
MPRVTYRMNSNRYITLAVFGIIAFGFLATHTFLKPVENEQVWVSEPKSGPVVESVIQSAKTPASVALASNDIKAAFERDTVIKLNSIVRRSLVTIRQYDAEIKTVRENNLVMTRDSVNEDQVAAARSSLAKLQEWNLEASQALKDMNAAVAELEASDEYYNAAILAGMVRFVETVATEIGDEYLKLIKLAGQDTVAAKS